MAKNEITFSLEGLELRDPLTGKRAVWLGAEGDEGAKVDKAEVPASETASILENVPFNQLPEELQFGPMGGCPIVFRSSVVRLAFMKITATGVLAAMVAVTADNTKVAFSCCLAAAVNFIACIHYYLICERSLPLRLLTDGIPVPVLTDVLPCRAHPGTAPPRLLHALGLRARRARSLGRSQGRVRRRQGLCPGDDG